MRSYVCYEHPNEIFGQSNVSIWKKIMDFRVKLPSTKGLLRVSRTAKKPNQSILKEINPKYSLKGLMLN